MTTTPPYNADDMVECRIGPGYPWVPGRVINRSNWARSGWLIRVVTLEEQSKRMHFIWPGDAEANLRREAAPPPGPLDVKYDGVKLLELLCRDQVTRQFDRPARAIAWPPLTPTQRAAVSAHWSTQLRAKVAESDGKRGPQIVLDCAEDL